MEGGAGASGDASGIQGIQGIHGIKRAGDRMWRGIEDNPTSPIKFKIDKRIISKHSKKIIEQRSFTNQRFLPFCYFIIMHKAPVTLNFNECYFLPLFSSPKAAASVCPTDHEVVESTSDHLSPSTFSTLQKGADNSGKIDSTLALKRDSPVLICASFLIFNCYPIFLLSKAVSRKSVSFSKVFVREHCVILGDHPACDMLPLCLGWSHADEKTFDVDIYEQRRLKQRTGRSFHGSCQRLSFSDRMDTLKRLTGMDYSDIMFLERRRRVNQQLEQ